jgi:hypothetical protein
MVLGLESFSGKQHPQENGNHVLRDLRLRMAWETKWTRAFRKWEASFLSGKVTQLASLAMEVTEYKNCTGNIAANLDGRGFSPDEYGRPRASGPATELL